MHEAQVGSKDLSDFIDKKVKGTSLHDAVYKGKEMGLNVPKELGEEYKGLMGKITEANRNGSNVAQDAALKSNIDDFAAKMEKHIPDKLAKGGPAGEAASTGTKLKIWREKDWVSLQ